MYRFLAICENIPALNKGRSTYPGNTRLMSPTTIPFVHAQQRPEYKPRQHHGLRRQWSGHRPRSTKAGVQTPATHFQTGCASRKPDRSTKAGAQTPATRMSRCSAAPAPGSLNKGRSTNPGNTALTLASDEDVPHAQQRPEHKPRQHP